MATRFAWVLNLDADVELARLLALVSYVPTRAMLDATRTHAARLVGSLVSPDDLLVDEATPAGAARGLVGRAFCPTPRALALLVHAGATPEPHPPLSVLRAVNSRAFAASLGATLPGASFARTLEEALSHIAAPPRLGDGWRMKRAFGMAGRGQRIAAAAPSEADVAFLVAGLAEGGVQLEPNVLILEEYAVHGMLATDCSAALGEIVRQRCDARGAWLATERVRFPSSLGEVPTLLAAEARAVATALAGAGYFGPFGVDAFTYRDADGAAALQPRSEINARYSMGFAVGFAVSSRAP